MINLTFVFLRIIMLYILGLGGYYVQKSKENKYWKYLFLPIVVFTLNEGLRWGRGIDYNLYYYTYENLVKWNENSGFEPLYSLFIRSFVYLQLTWQHFVAFMSLVLIISGCWFMRNYKEVILWALPLFALQVLIAENLMRWFLGFSFILIGIYYLINEKRNVKLFWLFSLMGVLCHYGLILVVPIFYFVSRASKPLFKPMFSISAILLSVWLFKGEIMLTLAKIINLFSLSGRFEGYQQNLDAWLVKGTSEKGADLDVNVLIMYIVLLYVGYILTNKLGKKYIYVYNLFLIGALTYSLRIIEIAYRYSILFSLFDFLVFAYVIQFIIIRKYRVSSWLLIACWIILLNYLRVNLIMPLFNNPYRQMYIWDSGGEETLDLMLW